MSELRSGGALLTVVMVTVAGCAYGGGGSGRQDDDAGRTTRIDGGPSGRDAAAFDGANDARPSEDSGASVDAGRDGGSVVRPDSGPTNTCAESPCRVGPPQCGCGAGEACYVGDDSARTCNAIGTLREGQVCTGPFSCAPGLQCTGDGEGAVCLRYCNTDTDCPGGDGAICAIQLSDGAGGTLPGVRLCSIDCDPVRSVGCASGSTCLVSGGAATYSMCRSAGAGIAGSFCDAHTDCGPRLVCVDTGGGGRCHEYCTDDFDCSGWDLCQLFASPRQQIGGVSYGFCR